MKHLLVMLLLAFLTAGCSAQMKLEELLQRLEQERPWTPTKIEAVLGAKPVRDNTSNEYWTFYSIGPVDLEEGLIIERLHFGLKGAAQTIAGFTVYFSDRSSCITRHRIIESYPDIQKDFQNMPRGHSLDEKVYYYTKRTWGTLAFGFKERRPECLASVVFRPIKD